VHLPGTGSEWWYHWKADELKRSNPSGLVPTLIPIDNNGKPNEEKSVYESLITIDYIDSIANPTEEKNRLVPSDPYLAAKCRYWADRLTENVVHHIMEYSFELKTRKGKRTLIS